MALTYRWGALAQAPQEEQMIGTVKTLAAAALLASTASMASAVPANIGQLPENLSSAVVRVHGDHRSCQLGRRGWHRHNRYGERRPCREWRGEGRRPDYCVRVGPLWYCDY
jgi:hypothetical protein